MTMKAQKVVIFGIGDFAKTLYSYLENDDRYEIVAFCVDREYINELFLFGVNILDFDDLHLEKYSSSCKALLAVGYSNMRRRAEFYNRIKKLEFDFLNFIHPTAVVSNDVSIGEGNVIFPSVVIEPGVVIGSNNIIWSSTNVCHDVVIGSHTFIAAQSLVGGFSKIGDCCFLGFNSTVTQNIVVSDEVLIGAKSLLMNDANRYGKYIGIPAKFVSCHEDKGIILK